MSLYNMIMGVDRNSMPLLKILNEVEELEIPRFRDCYLSGNCICILTRTGGGNREEYEEMNDKMTEHPLYVNNTDCDWDTTYAEFYFSFTDDLEADLKELVRIQKEAQKAAKAAKKVEEDESFEDEKTKATNSEKTPYIFSDKFRKIFKMSTTPNATPAKNSEKVEDATSNSTANLFWIGPHDIKVPDHVKSLPSSDGGNTHYKDGSETEMGVPAKYALNKEQYMLKYGINKGSVLSPDWWYDTTKK
jgi:hypothetical protein